MVELDLRRTRDGEIVVLHDATLARLWGDERKVADLDLAAVREIGRGHDAHPYLWRGARRDRRPPDGGPERTDRGGRRSTRSAGRAPWRARPLRDRRRRRPAPSALPRPRCPDRPHLGGAGTAAARPCCKSSGPSSGTRCSGSSPLTASPRCTAWGSRSPPGRSTSPATWRASWRPASMPSSATGSADCAGASPESGAGNSTAGYSTAGFSTSALTRSSVVRMSLRLVRPRAQPRPPSRSAGVRWGRGRTTPSRRYRPHWARGGSPRCSGACRPARPRR